jgi:tetratricopeptide (TPR) repeat protein
MVARYPEIPTYRLSLGKLLTYRASSRAAGMEMLESVKGGYEKDARTAWRQALIWENGNRSSVPSLRSYLARYPDPEIEAILQRAGKQAPQQAAVTGMSSAAGKALELAYAALKANRLAEAEKGFQAILKTSPHEGQALAGLGYVQMKNQDFSGALASFEEAKTHMAPTKDLNDAIGTARFWLYMKDAASALKEQRSEDAEALFQKALSLRPEDRTALEGYAGALMQHGDQAAATPVLERLVRLEPANAEAWRTLIGAEYQKAGAQAALKTVRTIPVAVASKLNQDLSYLIVLVSIYRDAGDVAESSRAFRQTAALARAKRDIPEGMQLQLAGLYLQYGEPSEAAAIYRRLIDATPENLDAWEGLMLSLGSLKDYRRALHTLEELPATLRPNALARPGFLRAVASVQRGMGNLGSAESLLSRALEVESTGGATPSFYTQLQLAQVWLEQGQHERAIRMFGELAKNYPDNRDSWKGLIAGLHQDKRDQEALDVSGRIPADTSRILQDDSDYLSLMASIYSANGQNDQALRLVRQAAAHYQGSGEKLPAELSIQLAWLLLDDEASRRELYGLLQDLRERAELTAEQRQTVAEILSTWVLRSSQAARTAGDNERSEAILEAGMRAIPSDPRIRRALAGDLLADGNPHRALALYKNAGLKNASSSDYVAAAGTALAERETRLATAWIAEGLRKYPSDPELLNMAGREAAAKGDFKTAQAFFHRALQAAQAEERKRVAADLRNSRGGGDSPTGTDELGSLLLGGPAPAFKTRATQPDATQPRLKDSPEWLNNPAGPTKGPSPSFMPDATPRSQTNLRMPGPVSEDIPIDAEPRAVEPGSLLAVAMGRSHDAGWITAPSPKPPVAVMPADEPQRVTLVAQTSAQKDAVADPPQIAAPPIAADPLIDLLKGEAPTGSAMTAGTEIDQRQQIEDEIKTLDERNTPYAGTENLFQSRSGQPGFDKMSMQESDLEASTLVGNSVRVGLMLRGIFLNSPAPDGTSTLRFGMLPAGDTFGAQSLSGLGAEAQLATTNFGMHVGSTPQSFLVRNWIGGFRFRPGGGPITIQFDRDSVKETVLSFAGAKDPLTGIKWGGVIANAATLLGNWGNEKAGTYFSTGFQYITGQNVENNERVDGTMGSYWRLVATPAGSLTAGMNLFAMHYTNNLRYFTYGQGGYFSPQRFVLFNVPLTWTGKWKLLQYTASTSIGSQAFSENASAFFPTAPGLQGVNGSYYPNYSSTGVNYNVDFRLAYQLSSNWYVAGFFNANNASFYRLNAIGITVRYSIKERPLNPQFVVPSIPDWKGKQPFGLP